MAYSADVWIGTAEVVQFPGVALLRYERAYVNVIVASSGSGDFAAKASQALADAGFGVAAWSDVEPFDDRFPSGSDAAMQSLVARALSTGIPQFGSFHTWSGAEERG